MAHYRECLIAMSAHANTYCICPQLQRSGVATFTDDGPGNDARSLPERVLAEYVGLLKAGKNGKAARLLEEHSATVRDRKAWKRGNGQRAPQDTEVRKERTGAGSTLTPDAEAAWNALAMRGRGAMSADARERAIHTGANAGWGRGTATIDPAKVEIERQRRAAEAREKAGVNAERPAAPVEELRRVYRATSSKFPATR